MQTWYCPRELATLLNSVGIEKALWYQREYWNQMRKRIRATIARVPRGSRTKQKADLSWRTHMRVYRKWYEDIVRRTGTRRKGNEILIWSNERVMKKDDVYRGGSTKADCHWSTGLKKGWIFEWTSLCKGWSARECSSIDVACVLRKRERERER